MSLPRHVRWLSWGSFLFLIGGLAPFAIDCKIQQPQVAIDVPPAERFKISLRFALLVPFEKVTAAARSEFKIEGGTEESERGEADVVHFKLTEENLKAAKTGRNALGQHNDVDQAAVVGGEDTRDDMELRMWQEPNILVTQVRFRRSGTDDMERAGFKKRAKTIFRVIANLPGVGPAVDRDGVPRDTQYNTSAITEDDAGAGTSSGETKIEVNPMLMGDAGQTMTDAGKASAADGGRR